MSLPPPPPQSPPPGPPPYGGPPQGPPGSPQGFPPYGAGPGRPPRGSNTGFILGVVGLVVLLIAGLTTIGILLTRGDDGDSSADQRPSRDGSASASPSGSPSSTSSPSSPSTSPSSSRTAYAPTDDGADEKHIAGIKTADYPGDWNFKYGNRSFAAKLVKTTDHKSCGPIETGSALTSHRCQYAAEWDFTALGGKIKQTLVMLYFDTADHAESAESQLRSADLEFPDGALYEGKQRKQALWFKATEGNILVLTVNSTNTKVDPDKVDDYVKFMNTDYKLAVGINASFGD